MNGPPDPPHRPAIGQPALFGATGGGISLPDTDCSLVLHADALTVGADELFDAVRTTTPWKQHHVVLFGERHPVPRLESWHGDPGRSYTYSGNRLEPEAWTEALTTIKSRIEPLCGVSFNSVLCNLYRTGADKVGWHADDEPELGADPIIASVSLGATRRFRLRPIDGGDPITLDLEHGSVLVMSGATQRRYVHELARTKRPVGERINLTYRIIR